MKIELTRSSSRIISAMPGFISMSSVCGNPSDCNASASMAPGDGNKNGGIGVLAVRDELLCWAGDDDAMASDSWVDIVANGLPPLLFLLSADGQRRLLR